MKTKKVELYHDGQGWIARCTEYDKDGQPIIGRIAMDEPMEYSDDLGDIIREAAEHWDVPVAEIIVEN